MPGLDNLIKDIAAYLKENEAKPKDDLWEMSYFIPFYGCYRFYKRMCNGDYGIGFNSTSFNNSNLFYHSLFVNPYNFFSLEILESILKYSAEFFKNI